MQRLAATATAFPMTTYEQSNFEQIATAIGIARVTQYKNLFEAAALWYRLGQRRLKRIAPSKLCEKLDRVAKNARREVAEQLADLLDEPVRLHPNLAAMYHRDRSAECRHRQYQADRRNDRHTCSKSRSNDPA